MSVISFVTDHWAVILPIAYIVLNWVVRLTKTKYDDILIDIIFRGYNSGRPSS